MQEWTANKHEHDSQRVETRMLLAGGEAQHLGATFDAKKVLKSLKNARKNH